MRVWGMSDGLRRQLVFVRSDCCARCRPLPRSTPVDQTSSDPRGPIVAARSTFVTLDNTTRFNLARTALGLDHGEWIDQPPQIIGNQGTWKSESNGLLTGTEGSASYSIRDLYDVEHGLINVLWDNPFVGSNSYSQSVRFLIPRTHPGPGQDDWVRCGKCRTVFWNGEANRGVCAAGGAHVIATTLHGDPETSLKLDFTP